MSPLNLVGVALAPDETGPTGLAVLDEDGALVHAATVHTDDEVVAELSPYVEDRCVVALDAPLVAVRDGERPRAARIARRLGLDLNPRSGRPRRAVEATADELALARLEQPGEAPGDGGGAVACAQVALRAARARAGHAPGEADVAVAVRRYADLRPALVEATGGWVRLVTSILDEAGINYLTVTGRTKSLASYAAKAARTQDGAPVYPDPLRDITDQVGLRVITYVHSDVQAVVDLLADQVEVRDDRDLGEETASQGRFGYASRHLLIGVPDEERDHPGRGPLHGHQAQVQIRTVLQHAWAEFEHDIRYKGSIPEEHVPEFDRRFTLAAGLLELADREFSTIRDRLRHRPAEDVVDRVEGDDHDDDPRLSPRDLAAFLAGQYPDAGWSRTDHYAWIARVVLELGITSLTDLGDAVRAVDTDELTRRMGYRYPPGAVRRLDDALLWLRGEEYVGLSANQDRVEALRSRLARMRAAG
jgi:ppGpp synthetase/RelA/SpoT-type nucleotidyltranferase